MNTEPPTGDEMQKLLVSLKRAVLEQAPEKRRRHRRTIGIVVGIVGALTIASASGALALGALKAQTPDTPQESIPTSTSTVSPIPRSGTSVSSAVPKDYPPPTPQIPLDCASLGTAIDASSAVPGASASEYAGLWLAPRDAMMRQNGLLTCTWSTGEGSTLRRLSVVVSPHTAGAREWIERRISDGDTDFGVDTASAIGCHGLASCSVSMVGHRFWIEMSYDGNDLSPAPAAELLGPMAQRAVDVLTSLTVSVPWKAPASSWSAVQRCGDVRTTTPLAAILKVPGLVGPQPDDLSVERSGLEQAFGGLVCMWSVPKETDLEAESTRRVYVQIVPGGGWAYQQAVGNDAGGTVVSVNGAQGAVLQCSTVDASCWLDVLNDDSWLQVNVLKGYGTAGSDKNVLVRTAEAILAAHNSR